MIPLRIHERAIINNRVTLGSDVVVEAYAVLGSPAEMRGFMRRERGSEGVMIGRESTIREFCTINAGTVNPTCVGERVTMLRGSHVGHDAEIQDDVTLSCNVMVGGHAYVGQGANLGLGAVVHQWRAIGAYSMIGMGSVVTKNIPPFFVAMGNPAKLSRLNTSQIIRHGFDEAALEQWRQHVMISKSFEPQLILKLAVADLKGKEYDLVEQWYNYCMIKHG